MVTLIMQYSTGSFICTGSLIGASTILTAGHCVSEGYGTENPITTTAYFRDWGNTTGDPHWSTAGAVGINVTNYYVNSGYTGEVIDQNDIAILSLASEAPDFATIYDLYYGDLEGERFNIAGFGNRSTTGGAAGATTGTTGYLRQGDNTYSYAWGASEFGGFFTDEDANGENFFGFADVEYSYVSDFDNGTNARDAGCRIAAAVGAAGFGCETGIGALEVGVAGGDSGGPQFIDGKISSVTSYGLSFGTAYGDINNTLNSSFGEFSGYVPVYIHRDWIESILNPAGAIPEPQTWAMLIVGFGAVGLASRRRRNIVAA